MSGNTKDLSRPPITSSGRGHKGYSYSETPPPAVRILSKPDLVGCQFGPIKVLSAECRVVSARGGHYVKTLCTTCDIVGWRQIYSLTRPKKTNCKHCPNRKRVPDWLYQRLIKAKARCEDPNATFWARYGGRGIRFDFPSTFAAALWVYENLGTKKGMEIDRIDNNGPYAAGNLKWSTRVEQCQNRSTSKIRGGWLFRQEEWPYSEKRTRVLLRAGWTREQILEHARETVRKRRAHWRNIEARFASMTS